jgi:hypothetical protein
MPGRDPGPRRVTLYPPEVGPQTARFAFEVTPAVPALYRATRFSLSVPPWLDLRTLPERLWWTVLLLCLHSQWPHLAPCEVRVPVRLGPGEAEFWRRLVVSYVDTLEAYATGPTPGRAIELVDGGPSLAPFRPFPDAGWCGTTFSGGKDSLVQVGVLTELTARPLVVTTTSPRDDIPEHSTARRRQVLSEIGRRRDLTFVEVHSDFRSTWENYYPASVGYPLSVNETTDTFLYFAALLVAGLALGATRLFLASEAEVQQSVERGGRVVQHPHFMYSAATQRALSAWLAPAGITYGSLTWPLHSAQVLHLLWTRYGDLADLQYSCFNVGVDQATCSRCGQCFRIALGILAARGDPERIGIDLPAVLQANAGWRSGWPAEADALPNALTRADLAAGVARSLRAVSPARLLARMARRRPTRLADPATWAALAAYRRVRAGVAGLDVPPPRYRAGFLGLVDSRLRPGLEAICAAHFPAAPPALDAPLVARSEAVTRWIVEPLAAGPAAPRPVPAGAG